MPRGSPGLTLFYLQVPVGSRAADSGVGHVPGGADEEDKGEKQRGGVFCGNMQGWRHQLYAKLIALVSGDL